MIVGDSIGSGDGEGGVYPRGLIARASANQHRMRSLQMADADRVGLQEDRETAVQAFPSHLMNVHHQMVYAPHLCAMHARL